MSYGLTKHLLLSKDILILYFINIFQNFKMSLLKSVFIILVFIFVTANAGRVRLQNGEVVCACTMNLDPVCATNGETYSNLCTFECARDEAVELGRTEIRLINERGECLR